MQGVIPNAARCPDERSKDWPKQDVSASFPVLGDHRACYPSATLRAVEQGKSRMVYTVQPDDQTMSVDDQHGVDLNTGDPIIQRIIVLADGTTNVTYFEPDGVTPVTGSPSFSAAEPNTQVKTETMFDTNPANGAVVEVQQVTPVTVNPDNTITFGTTAYRTADGTADYTPVGTVANKPIRLKLDPAENLPITGAAEVALAAIPANAGYAEVYIDAGASDAGIRWTKDASAPADNNGEQENMGATIKLFSRPEIENFRALAIDASGNLDPALTANLTVDYWNVGPNADDL